VEELPIDFRGHGGVFSATAPSAAQCLGQKFNWMSVMTATSSPSQGQAERSLLGDKEDSNE